MSARLKYWLIFLTCSLPLFSACPDSNESPEHPSLSQQAARDTSESPGDDETAPESSGVDPLADTYPLYGTVTGLQLSIRTQPRRDAPRLGVLRLGAQIRLRDRRHPSERCASGWYPIHPRGWACVGQGIELSETPPETEAVQPANQNLPYAYFRVNQEMTAEYHRPPTPEVQRATWNYARRYRELLETNETRAARFLEGELPNEPTRPPRVRRFLRRGFYVASPLEHDPSAEFTPTVQGSHVWRERLRRRTGSDFVGVHAEEGGALELPLVWMRRTARPRRQRPRADGTMRWAENAEIEPLERHALVEGWLGRERFGERIMHVLEDEQYFLSWFLSVAQPPEAEIANRFTFAPEEAWIHVDLSEQNLVVYRGERPIFATLISTGMEGHETPVGFFRIQRKLRTATMANLGPDAGDDAYRIEDVPWTQYFEGNLAIHGSFWHNRFGLERSHGCINLSPADARTVFELTDPPIPEGWHGVESDLETNPGSRLIITH